MMTIVSVDEDIDYILEAAKESLTESMDQGEFVDSSLGIVRVTSSSGPIQDESLQEETDSSLLGEDDNDSVRPVSHNGSLLGIGLSAAGAGFLLFLVGASVYRRKQNLKSNDASTLQEGVTMNGLSRFDITHDDHGIEDMVRDVEILPLSPAARPADHRYTSDGGSILTLGRCKS